MKTHNTAYFGDKPLGAGVPGDCPFPAADWYGFEGCRIISSASNHQDRANRALAEKRYFEVGAAIYNSIGLIQIACELISHAERLVGRGTEQPEQP